MSSAVLPKIDSQAVSQASPSHLAMSNPIPTVMIADDDPNLRMLLSYALEQEGYRTIEALDGLEALQLAQQHHFDLILLDAVMPRLDGISCCTRLHERHQHLCPPVILITALSDTASVDRAFQAGASDFVTKPIHWPILRERLKRQIEIASLRREMQLAQAQIQDLTSQLADLSAKTAS